MNEIVVNVINIILRAYLHSEVCQHSYYKRQVPIFLFILPGKHWQLDIIIIHQLELHPCHHHLAVREITQYCSTCCML